MVSTLTPSAVDTAGTAERPRRRRANPYPLWFFAIPAVLFIVFFAIPTFSSFYFSLTRWTLQTTQFIGLENFVLFFNEPTLVSGFIHTFIYAFLTSGVKVVLGILLARVLTSHIIGRGYLRSVVFFPVLVSTIGVGLTFKILMDPFNGLINKTLAMVGITGPGWLTDPNIALYSVILVDIWKGVGIATLIFIAGMVGIPQEYYEAAKVDGSSGRQMFINITLPLLKPATITVVTLSLIGGLRSFDLIGDDQRRARLHQRRHRLGHLQAVPGRVLRPVHRRQRGAVPGRHRDHRADVDLPQPAGGQTMEQEKRRAWIVGIIAILVSIVIFLIPFAFILLTASKTVAESADLAFSLPTEWVLFQNISTVLQVSEAVVLRAFINSTTLTVCSVIIMVVLAAMVGYILDRRQSKWCTVANFFVLAGLIVPPAVVPTVWVLQGLGLFKPCPA